MTMTAPPREPLVEAIRHAINCHSAENASNTPDYILAQFLVACLAAFSMATQQRETWHGRDARPIAPAPSADNKPTPGMLRGLSKIAADLAAYRNGTAPSAEPPAQAATDKLGRICEHGQLARSCDHCDNAREIAELRATIEQQAREIARMTDVLESYRGTYTREKERAERAEAERDALREDAERVEWFFGGAEKMWWMSEYMRGMREGWTVDQWRAAIDAARGKP